MVGVAGWSIVGHVGPNGSGKTLCMVEKLAVPAMAKGEPIFSNFGILDTDGKPYWNWFPLTKWGQALTARDGLVLLDEVEKWVPSSEWSKLPADVLSHLNQHRHARRSLSWSGPSSARLHADARGGTRADVAAAVARGGLVACVPVPLRAVAPPSPALLGAHSGAEHGPHQVPVHFPRGVHRLDACHVHGGVDHAGRDGEAAPLEFDLGVVARRFRFELQRRHGLGPAGCWRCRLERGEWLGSLVGS